jgi:hypothetical protein
LCYLRQRASFTSAPTAPVDVTIDDIIQHPFFDKKPHKADIEAVIRSVLKNDKVERPVFTSNGQVWCGVRASVPCRYAYVSITIPATRQSILNDIYRSLY